MIIRIFCLTLLGFTVAMWATIIEMEHVSDLSKFGMHIFYAGACLIFGYGIVTGKAPI